MAGIITQVAAPHVSSYTAKSPDRLQLLELHRHLSGHTVNSAATLQNLGLHCNLPQYSAMTPPIPRPRLPCRNVNSYSAKSPGTPQFLGTRRNLRSYAATLRHTPQSQRVSSTSGYPFSDDRPALPLPRHRGQARGPGAAAGLGGSWRRGLGGRARIARGKSSGLLASWPPRAASRRLRPPRRSSKSW